MKIKELIEKLQEYDGDLEVYVNGYEGGVNSLTNIGDPVTIALNVNDVWFYGDHEVVGYGNEYEGHERSTGIIL